jgi:1-deoxy-D-xylulose-5-phosphate synthase
VLKELLESAFSWGRPTAIRYPNLATEETNAPLRKIELGKGEILVPGKDLCIIALGHCNKTAVQVRENLKSYGIEATVVDPVFIKPLDKELILGLLENHRQIVTLEEHSVMSGLGAILNHFLMSNDVRHCQVLNLGIPEAFIEQGSHAEIMDFLGLTAAKITLQIAQHFDLKPLALSV